MSTDPIRSQRASAGGFAASALDGNATLPKAEDTHDHYRFLYDVLAARQRMESDRIDKIDSKIAALLAGLTAAFGLLFQQLTWWQAGLFLVTFGLLLFAYRGQTWAQPPHPKSALENIDKGLEWKTQALVKAIVRGLEENRAPTKRKVDLMNCAIAMVFLIILTASFPKLLDVLPRYGAITNGRTATTATRTGTFAGRRKSSHGLRGEKRKNR